MEIRPVSSIVETPISTLQRSVQFRPGVAAAEVARGEASRRAFPPRDNVENILRLVGLRESYRAEGHQTWRP